jgi:colanic acid biosynthesis protein WcaH
MVLPPLVLMIIHDAIAALDNIISDKSRGLPDDVYHFISRTTPLVCTDLLVKDAKGRILLAWRDDVIYGKGWHVPGGIVRYKETFAERIQRTAERELGCNVSFEQTPVAIEELIVSERETCGHIVVFLFNCSVPDGYIPDNKDKNADDPGFLQWHEICPDNLLSVQNYYKKYFQST